MTYKDLTNEFNYHGFYIKFLKKNFFKNYTLTKTYKTGIIIDEKCSNEIEVILEHADMKNFFSVNNFWLLIVNTIENIENKLQNIFITPQSNFEIGIISNRTNENLQKILTIYKIERNTPLKFFTICENIKTIHNLKYCEKQFKMQLRKRKNLEGIYIKCGLVVAFPDIFTTIDDMRMRHIDTIAKANYPITNALRNDMNFK